MQRFLNSKVSYFIMNVLTNEKSMEGSLTRVGVM